MAWAATAVAVGGSLLASSGSDDSWKQQARNQGTTQANVRFQRARAWEEIPRAARGIAEELALEEVQIEKNASRAEADAIVAAAAAGVEGGSVNAQLDDIEHNAGMARGAVESKRQGAEEQLRMKAEDAFWQADSNYYKFRVSGNVSASGGDRLLEAAFAGASAYFGAR